MQYLQFHNIARWRGKSAVSDEKHLRNNQERFFEVNITNHKRSRCKESAPFKYTRYGKEHPHFSVLLFLWVFRTMRFPFLCFLSSESILSAFWHLSVLYQNELISSATLIAFMITFLDAQVLMQTFLYHRVVT